MDLPQCGRASSTPKGCLRAYRRPANIPRIPQDGISPPHEDSGTSPIKLEECARSAALAGSPFGGFHCGSTKAISAR